MKKNFFYIFTIFAAVLFVSCGTTSNMVKSPKFTSVDRLCQIKPGNSYELVTQTLGCDPYNILSNQIDGYAIYLFKFKFTEREVKAEDSEIFNQRGGETAGVEVYTPQLQDAILIFKNNKLETILTVQGRKDSPSLVLINNTLYEISKDKSTYVIVPTAINEPVEEESAGLGGVFNFGGKKKNK